MYTCNLNPLQICRGTLGNVLNVSHTEEWAQRRYPVHCSMHTTPPGHWQLRRGDHRMECSVWTHTVPLQDPSTEQQLSWYANIPMNFQWIMISDLLILNPINLVAYIMHNSYRLLLLFRRTIRLRVRWIFILFICICECVLRCWWFFNHIQYITAQLCRA